MLYKDTLLNYQSIYFKTFLHNFLMKNYLSFVPNYGHNKKNSYKRILIWNAIIYIYLNFKAKYMFKNQSIYLPYYVGLKCQKN